jgi:hypothetical protein
VSLSVPSEAAHKLLGEAGGCNGITMFVRIRLLRRLDPRKVYALFVLFQFDDYGHLRSVASLLRWVGLAIRYTLLLRLPLPRPEKHHP